MENNLSKNPFTGLFESANDAREFRVSQSSENSGNNNDQAKNSSAGEGMSPASSVNSDDTEINNIVENVFSITLDRRSGNVRPLIYLGEIMEPKVPIDMDTFERALFERLLLDNPHQHLVSPKGPKSNTDDERYALGGEAIFYLFVCYGRLQDLKKEKPSKNFFSVMDSLVIRNAATALSQPDLYAGQKLDEQLIGIFRLDEHSSHAVSFLTAIAELIAVDEGKDAALRAFCPALDYLKQCIGSKQLMLVDTTYLHILEVWSSSAVLGRMLIQHSKPPKMGKNLPLGRAYEDTLLGTALGLSPLPKNPTLQYMHFHDAMLPQTINQEEGLIWTKLASVCDLIHTVFHNLLRHPGEIRHEVLAWLGDCLHANAGRGKLWNMHATEMDVMGGLICVSDGLMLNLGAVLLRLCRPFLGPKGINKLLLIDPTYCAVQLKEEDSARSPKVHMHGLHLETCLVPVENDVDSADSTAPERPFVSSYGFVTECFFLTQRAIDLGMRVVQESLNRVSQDLARIQRTFRDTQASVGSSEVLDSIKTRLEREMVRFLSIKAALLEPQTLELCGQLQVGTATWLSQVALHFPDEGCASYAPLNLLPVTFPLPDTVPPTLSCVPEFIIENMATFLALSRRYCPRVLEQLGASQLSPLLTTVLMFMGSSNYMRNPHLRARLAECLESLLPKQDDESSVLNPNPLGSTQRAALFRIYPHRSQIVSSLLDVFVGIEMTGQSVAFEQKFNYRRPMYVVMDYLWKIEEHRGTFKQLAAEAEQNMEAVNPPIFLRFINLLMNDAVFLLDEALSNMAQLRTLQTARENGEWSNLPQREEQQNEGHLQHIGMIARFDNILGLETIHALTYLTSEITSIFCHPTMVDRIAAMLNYFLSHLVGPKKKNFLVKGKKEFDFKPSEIVFNICQIYVHLSNSDAFCLAVSQDGRSYTPQLFSQAEHVLGRIGHGVMIADLREIAKKVSSLASQQQTDDEILANAPEEFMDPIMSCLMTDPVILPSSRMVIDRATIARHLLSDQTDPFNRSPLTMDQVKPHEELQQRIQEWIQQQRAAREASVEEQSVPEISSQIAAESVDSETSSEIGS